MKKLEDLINLCGTAEYQLHGYSQKEPDPKAATKTIEKLHRGLMAFDKAVAKLFPYYSGVRLGLLGRSKLYVSKCKQYASLEVYGMIRAPLRDARETLIQLNKALNDALT